MSSKGAARSTARGNEACRRQRPQGMTLASLRSLATSSFTSATLPPPLRFGGSTTLSVVRRGVTSTPSAAGVVGLERLLLRLHDVRQRRVARLVEPQVGRHDRRQLSSRRVSRPAVDLALDASPCRWRCRPWTRTSPAASRAARRASGRSGWRRRRSPACPGSRAAASPCRPPPSGALRPRGAAAPRRSRPGWRGRRRCASAVRSVSWQAATPQDTATTSVAMPFSFRRTASSTAISSKGFIDILTLAVSTPEPSGLTRTLTLKSTTRLMETATFIGPVVEAWGSGS